MTIRVLIVEEWPCMAMLPGELIRFMGDEVAAIAETGEGAVAAADAPGEPRARWRCRDGGPQ